MFTNKLFLQMIKEVNPVDNKSVAGFAEKLLAYTKCIGLFQNLSTLCHNLSFMSNYRLYAKIISKIIKF